MKKVVPAATLVLLAASIVFASARREYYNNETCHSEWHLHKPAIQQPLVSRDAFGTIGSAVDSQQSPAGNHEELRN